VIQARHLLLASFLCGPLLSCSDSTSEISLGGDSLAGTYTGVLQETGGTAKYYVNLAETVTVTQTNPFELTFSSSAFAPLTAIVISTGQAAVNLNLVGYTPSAGVQVQEVGFTKDSHGSWVLAIQTASGLDGGSGSLVQFASYDPMDAPPASATAAVDYLEQILSMVSGSN
jgi:hypothetical protein